MNKKNNKTINKKFLKGKKVNIFDGLNGSSSLNVGGSSLTDLNPNMSTSTSNINIPITAGMSDSTAGSSDSVVSGASKIGTVAGNLIGTGISDGMETGVGSGISTLGSTIGGVVGMANPLLGGIISGASGIVGGLYNRAFGSKLNQNKINQIDVSNKGMNTLTIGSGSNNSILNSWSTQDLGSSFTKGDIGKDGWFANKAASKYRQLLKDQTTARNRALTGLTNAANATDTQNDLNIMANYKALGGQLFNPYSYGGSIHINPANRGKFNALKERTGKSTEELTHSKNPLTRKRAIFAQNAAKWHHAYGGYLNKFDIGGDLMINGGDFSNGVRYIDNGGTHEENPNEGVQMGIDNNGTPNLVEQGEVVYNDYVYSNRLKADKKLLDNVLLPTSYKDKTFADIAKGLSKESEERPNDPISTEGLEINMARLAGAQEHMRKKEQLKQFNKLPKEQQIDILNNALSSQQNTQSQQSQQQQPQSQDSQQDQNQSQEQQGQPEDNQQYACGGILGNKYSGLGPVSNFLDVMNESPQTYWGYNKVQPITVPYRDTNDYSFTPYFKSTVPGSTQSNNVNRSKAPIFIDINGTPNAPDTIITPNKSKSVKTSKQTTVGLDNNEGLTALRYAPVVGAGIGVLSDLAGWTNRPDYSNADLVGKVADNMPTVNYKPVGNYLQYNPFDVNYYNNKAGAQAAATRRAIVDQGGGNRATTTAGLLASDYNTQEQTGQLARQAEEYNQGLKQRIEEFNRGTDQYNSQMDLQAQEINQQNRKLLLSARIAQAQMRAEENARTGMARNANLTNLFNSMGEIGREEFSRNMVNNDNSKYYGIRRNGTIYYKEAYYRLKKEDKNDVDRDILEKGYKHSYGGYLKLK